MPTPRAERSFSLTRPTHTKSKSTQTQKQSPSFNFLHIDTICPRLQVANGKDITEWYDIEDPATVEDLILEALQKHFSQASDTLITTPKWRSILSSKEGQESLLNETIEWDDDVPPDFLMGFATGHVSGPLTGLLGPLKGL